MLKVTLLVAVVLSSLIVGVTISQGWPDPDPCGYPPYCLAR